MSDTWATPPTQDEIARLDPWASPPTPAEAQATSGGPSRLESAARGASQGATLGFGDELSAGAGALAEKIRGQLPEALGGGHADPESMGDLYRRFRESDRGDNERAQQAHGGYYLGGQVAGGIPASAAIPGAGAATIGRAAATGAAYGAAAGLGGSGADLTKGEVGRAAADTAIGGAGGAVAGAGGYAIGKGIETARRFAASLGESKMVGALTGYLKNITERGGPPEARKAVAGRLMNEARKVAGDAPLPVDNFMRLADSLGAEAQNPAAGGISAEARQILDAAEAIGGKAGNAYGSATEDGPSVTLTELDNALKTWNKRVADYKNDPAKQRVAKMAADALRSDLNAASGDAALGEAATLLQNSRSQYGEAARASQLQKLLLQSESAKSTDKFISPGKFAVLNSGSNRAKVERLLADDPEALAAWRQGVDAAKLMAKGNDQWLPKQLTDLSPAATKAMRRLMTYGNVTKIFGSSENAKDFARLMSPDLAGGSRTALDIIGRISARIANDTRQARPAYADQGDEQATFAAGGQ